MTAMTTTTTPTGGGDEDSYAEDGDPNSQEEYRARVLLSQRTAELMANFKDYVSRDFDDGEDDGGNGENDDGLVSLTITGTHDDEDVENGDGDNDAAAVLRGGQGVKGMMNDSSAQKQQLFSIDDDENENNNPQLVDEFPHQWNNNRKKRKYAISYLKSKRTKRGISSVILLAIVIGTILGIVKLHRTNNPQIIEMEKFGKEYYEEQQHENDEDNMQSPPQMTTNDMMDWGMLGQQQQPQQGGGGATMMIGPNNGFNDDGFTTTSTTTDHAKPTTPLDHQYQPSSSSTSSAASTIISDVLNNAQHHATVYDPNDTIASSTTTTTTTSDIATEFTTTTDDDDSIVDDDATNEVDDTTDIETIENNLLYYELMAEKHHPIWFSRSADQYPGTDYVWATKFCQSQQSSSSSSSSNSNSNNSNHNMVLCPYEAYCPDSAGSVPAGGKYKDDENVIQYSPISDYHNGWVQVSSNDGNGCVPNKPDWAISTSGGLSLSSIEEQTRYVLCCKDMSSVTEIESTTMIDSSSSSMMAQPITTTPETATLVEEESSTTNPIIVEQSIIANEYKEAEKYSPKWYDRSDGWNGRTWDDAVLFCKHKHAGGTGTLCPYSTVCPTGPRHIPFGGVVGEKTDISHVHWTPLITPMNNWVMVGLGDDVCLTYMSVYFEDPLWGDASFSSDENSEMMTRYLVCCNNLDMIESSSSSMEEIGVHYNDSTTASVASVDSLSDEFVGNLEPKRYDRSDGWEGHTWNEAVNFCTQEHAGELCPYDVICPAGPQAVANDSVDPQQWIPIADSYNDWVTIGSGADYCRTYVNIYYENPAWGEAGDDDSGESITQAIMCCSKMTTAVSDSSAAIESSTTSDGHATADQALIQANTEGLRFDPKWYTRSDGWQGSSYGEAVSFCSSLESGGHTLCNYETYCPMGERNAVYNDDNQSDSLGEIKGTSQWAPTGDGKNHWVQIGKVDKNILCMTYHALSGVYPEWGETGEDSSSFTEYLMCCRNDVSNLGNIQKIPENVRVMKFDRNTGWKGQKYLDGISFCATQGSRIPCPYNVVCPMKSDGGSVLGEVEPGWVPIIDAPNAWARVGNATGTCMKYSDIEPYPPSWGLNGIENEEITRHILCCDELEKDNNVEIDDTVMILTPAEEIILDTMKPIWFGRHEGYHGTTHAEADYFCQSIGEMHLCPAEAYCPHGARIDKPLFLQKDAVIGEQWAPWGSYNNLEVEISNKYILIGTLNNGDPESTCHKYEDLNDGESPPWTLDQPHTDLKEHILCCMNQSLLKVEDDISKAMQSIWLDQSHGWKGGSYTDAEEFCTNLGGKKLCPYSAYCPHGAGKAPMGGHSVDFNLQGEQWAPVFGKSNEWVLVGTKYENLATTCFMHDVLEGRPPEWGLTNENTAIKKYIQCCQFDHV